MSDIKHTNIGLVDDGVMGYELRSPQSYFRYGYSQSTNIFFIYNIGTPNPDDRGRGYAKQLIQMFFELVKKRGGRIDVGTYTSSGEEYIKPVMQQFSKQYNVKLI
jgi:ribosomal protein S18 acetylase RimI-like enzyme